MSFSNKVVLVIGGCSGIGASAAILYAKEGANVAIVGRNGAKLKNVAEQCKKNGKAPLIMEADISIDKEAVRIINETIVNFGKLDVLVNNAGFARFGSIMDGKLLESYDEMMRTNLRGLMNLTQLAAPHLIKTKGNIVITSSIGATVRPVLPVFIGYGITKACLNFFTKGAALELAPYGVRVNAISPGSVTTDFRENTGSPEIFKDLKLNVPLNKPARPEEVADLMLFLTSEKASSITGSIYVIDNGSSLAW